jgi:hypothetical protein
MIEDLKKMHLELYAMSLRLSEEFSLREHLLKQTLPHLKTLLSIEHRATGKLYAQEKETFDLSNLIENIETNLNPMPPEAELDVLASLESTSAHAYFKTENFEAPNEL